MHEVLNCAERHPSAFNKNVDGVPIAEQCDPEAPVRVKPIPLVPDFLEQCLPAVTSDQLAFEVVGQI